MRSSGGGRLRHPELGKQLRMNLLDGILVPSWIYAINVVAFHLMRSSLQVVDFCHQRRGVISKRA